jgi:hypothetical protein
MPGAESCQICEFFRIQTFKQSTTIGQPQHCPLIGRLPDQSTSWYEYDICTHVPLSGLHVSRLSLPGVCSEEPLQA